MMITTITSVGFKIPEEYKQMEDFRLNNDMSEWVKHEDTQYISFVKTTYNAITLKDK